MSRPPFLLRQLLRFAVPSRDREYIMRDLDEEFDALIGAGKSHRAARRWYRQQVWGSVLPSLRRPRSVRSSRRYGPLVIELRSALRSVRRYPLFTLTAASTLALGVGGTAAMFAVVNGVLLKPLPYERAGSLVSVWHRAPGMNFETLNQTVATYFTYREENRVFDGIGLWDNNRISVTGVADPEQVDVILATGSTFDVLRVSPLLGRLFSPSDDGPGAPPTTVLTHGYWQRRFGGDPDIIGRTVTLNGFATEIIGVLGPEFRFLNFEPALFLPFRFDRASISGVYGFSYQAIARLRDGMTITHANSDVERMIPLVFEKFPGGRGISFEEAQTMGFGANVRPLKDEVVGNVSDVLLILLGTVGFVLVIATGNVANLFVVRAESRQREMTVRTALGASRASLRRQTLWETLAISLLGGGLGLVFAAGCVRILYTVGVDRLPRLEDVTIGPAVIGLTFAVSFLIGIIFSLTSAGQFVRRDLVQALRDSGRGGVLDRKTYRVRGVLVVTQLALGLVLVVGSGLLLRSFLELLSIRPGFERPEEVLTLRVAIPSATESDPALVAQTHEAILNRIREIPGVKSAALSSSVSMDGWDDNDAIYVQEQPLPQDVVPPVRQVKLVSGGYVETMENVLVAGRSITWADIYDRAAVVMVTENFAREYWDDAQSALGKRVADNWQGRWNEIVGVVGNVYDDGVDRAPTPIVYWPLVRRIADGSLTTERSLAYAIRSSRLRDPTFFDAVQQAVWSVNPNLPLASVRTLDEILERSMGRTWFVVVVLAIAAGASVLLAVVGVYGVVSYAVARRTSEMGVRMAFGATDGDVMRLILRQGATLAAVGIVIGLFTAGLVTRLIASLLTGVQPLDLLTYGLGAASLAAVALAATYLPARRAARVEPMVVLRWE